MSDPKNKPTDAAADASADAPSKSDAAKAVEGSAAKPDAGSSASAKPDAKSAAAPTIKAEAKPKSSANPPAKAPRVTPKVAARPAAPAESAPAKPTSASSAAEAAKPPPAPVEPTTSASAKPAAPAPAPQRSGIFVPLLGGVLAAAIGAAAALYLIPNGLAGQDDSLAEALSAQQAEIGALSAQIEELRAADPSAELDTLRGDIEAARVASSAAADALSEDVGALATRVDNQAATFEDLLALPDRIDTLTGRVGALEARPVDEAPDISGLQADVRALTERLESAAAEARDQVDTANARAAEIEAMVAAQAEADARQAAFVRLTGNVLSGAPYDAALDALASRAPDVAVPETLAESADSGLVTLQHLRETFPDSARAAIAADAAPGENATMGDRLAGFLRTQTGARSLSPRDGDSADAILSRAEAALTNGDVAAAVSEVETLGPEARPEMDGWVGDARARLDVLTALSEFSATLNTN